MTYGQWPQPVVGFMSPNIEVTVWDLDSGKVNKCPPTPGYLSVASQWKASSGGSSFSYWSKKQSES